MSLNGNYILIYCFSQYMIKFVKMFGDNRSFQRDRHGQVLRGDLNYVSSLNDRLQMCGLQSVARLVCPLLSAC